MRGIMWAKRRKASASVRDMQAIGIAHWYAFCELELTTTTRHLEKKRQLSDGKEIEELKAQE